MKFIQQFFFFQILLKFHALAEQTYILQTCVVQTQPIRTNYLLHRQASSSGGGLKLLVPCHRLMTMRRAYDEGKD